MDLRFAAIEQAGTEEMAKVRAILSAAVLSAVVGVAIGAATAARAQDCPGHPDAIGTSRVITIDPNDYRRLGTLQYRQTLRFDRISDAKVRWEIDAGIDNVSAALGEAGGLAPFFRIPGFGRTDVVESELAARSLVVFSTDAVADDWHRHISASQIIARAMSRLEAKGKGMLLLHDIHPWTVAALPGLLKALKDKGFHIVQAVPSATMPPGPIAARSVWTVAWSMAEQAVMDDSGSAPAWPKLSDSPITETADLPAPDEGAFDPHYVLSRVASTADIEVDMPSIEAGTATSPWPYQALVAMPSSAAQLPAPSLLDIGWPVQEREIADAALEPRASATANDASEPSEPQHGRARHARLISVPRHA